MRLAFKLLCSAILFTSVISRTTVAQTTAEFSQQIRSAVESSDSKKALVALRLLSQSDPTSFAANNYDYLQARLAQNSGDTTEASSAYQTVAARKSVLQQYALWHLAQLARSIGDLPTERERLRQLLLIAPSSLMREGATLRLGESFFESSDYDSAVSALQSLSQMRKSSAGRQASVLIGQSYLQLGKPVEARAVFTQLISQMPDASRPDDFALAAVRGLDSIDSTDSKVTKVNLTDADHLLRASVYQFNRDFTGARAHYQSIVQQSPQNSTVPNAVYQIGRGFYLEGNYEEAQKHFQRVVQQFPESGVARDAATSLASTFNRLKRPDDAISTYKDLIQRSPDPQNPERAYLNIIDILHEAGRYNEALNWVQQTRGQFRGQIGEALALFAQTRIHLAQANWQAVVTDTDALLKLPDLGGTRMPGGTTKNEVTFVRANALEQLGRTDEAINVYLSLPAGRNEYYGTRATQRLLAIAGNAQTGKKLQTRLNVLLDEANKALAAGQTEQARNASQSALRLTADPTTIGQLRSLLANSYAALPAYKLPTFNLTPFGRRQVLTQSAQSGVSESTHSAIADELFFLGVYDEALPEFAAVRSNPGAPPQPVKANDLTKQTPAASSGLSDIDYTIAVYSLRGGLANRAVRFAEQLWKNVPADYQLELAPRELVELLYPVPYRESLLKHASPRSVDTRFILSIARQESRFQADAKSLAAARGMMQFIPATANEIATQLGRDGSNQDDLYNPDTAILFGSQYLANLFKQFPEQPQAVASAYNGGPDNTARWIARSRSNDPDRYLPEIGFSQTKDYVYKVMSNYWVYEQFYDSQLQRKSQINK